MSNLDTIVKIDAALEELALHGVTLESFEVMRARIVELEGELSKRQLAYEADTKVANHWLACWREAMTEKVSQRARIAALEAMIDSCEDGNYCSCQRARTSELDAAREQKP